MAKGTVSVIPVWIIDFPLTAELLAGFAGISGFLPLMELYCLLQQAFTNALCHALLAGISRKYPINRDILDEIVRSDEKQRYSFSEDGTKIRANQGHSVQVDVELPVTEPPETLYYGTAQRFAASIEAQGLLPQSRLYVHLSPDQETAEKVGRRHGEPVIYLVDAGQMHRDGYCFYLSANGVWLTKVVPATYLKRLEDRLTPN